ELQVCLISAARVTALHRRIVAQRRELEQLNAELFEQARRDPLTDLGNRLLLNESLEEIMAQSERYARRYCAILFDVDHFKSYNDLYGHLAGDEVIKRVALAATENFRKADSVYRFGGEEFLALLPEQSLESAVVAAERLRLRVQELAIPHEGNDPPGVVTVSLGIAELRTGAQKAAQTLLKEADEALYRAKNSGRNAVAVYERPLPG
ncbi:MAG: GGDEF domain-containing protein, partial [Actinomycetota bacterium]